jgi:two-component system response regulator AtoC
MAGSQTHGKKPRGPESVDAVLAARLDSVKLLADQFSEPVAVVDRSHHVVYTNRPARELAGQEHRSDQAEATCHTVLFNLPAPCFFCPGKEVYEAGEDRFVAGLPELRGRQLRLMPLRSSDGTVDYLLEILGTALSAPAERPGSTSAHEAAGPTAEPVHRLGDLIGRSEPMRRLFDLIRLVANSHATVLLHGESGTGKELVARTIHRLSPRRHRPFVVVDCGSLTETLLESELFGHVKGAFTGAVGHKKGLFQEADGGTIFLDEIANTTAHFQSKLLRVLQESEIKPVGSNRAIKVDVRVISATNIDLQDKVKARSFRDDLFYRLAVLPLNVPPLRDRRDDIPILAQTFVAASCRRHRKPIYEVASEAMDRLTEQAWPGNVRELQHLIERAVVTATGNRLTAENFFGSDHGAPASRDLRSVVRQAVHQAERTRILNALDQAEGNRTKAAQFLKISRASLYNKLRDYQIR